MGKKFKDIKELLDNYKKNKDGKYYDATAYYIGEKEIEVDVDKVAEYLYNRFDENPLRWEYLREEQKIKWRDEAQEIAKADIFKVKGEK